MTTGNKRSGVATLLVAVFIFSCAAPALAAVFFSERATLRTTSGITFSNQAMVENEGDSSSSDTTTYATTIPPAAWMGAEARLLYANGALCKSSGMGYTSSSNSNFYRRTLIYGGQADVGKCGDGYFYGKGKSAVWNGSNYSYYYTLRTVNIYMID